MNDEKELATWRAEWASLGGRNELVTELGVRARRADLRFRAYRAANVLAVIFAVGLASRVVVKEQGSPLALTICGGLCFYGGILMMRLFGERLPEAGSTLDSFVAMTRARIERDLRWTRFADRSAAVLGVGFCVWWLVATLGPRAIFSVAPARALRYLAMFLAVVASTVWRTWRKRRRLLAEREQLEMLVAERKLD